MGYKILIIEDVAAQVKPLVQLLEYRGYEVLFAENGLDGIAKAVKDHPDLIVVDLLLVERGGEIDGFEVIRIIRNTAEISSIGILAWTGHYVSGQHEIQALRAGADDFVRKEVDYGLFEARIEALIRRVGNKRI